MANEVTRYNPAQIQPMERSAFIGMAVSAEGKYVLYSDYAELEQRYMALAIKDKEQNGTVKE